MAINSDELVKALQENLKLRRELATEMAGANGEKRAAVRYRSTRVLSALRSWAMSQPCCLADSVANLWSASWWACPNSKLLPKRLPSSGGQR